MSTVTDSYTMNIQIITHGIAHIVQPVAYPETVEADTPFDITYTTKNDGTVQDTLFGRMLVGGAEIPNSAWTEVVDVNGTVVKTYHHPGISEETTITIEVGHE